MKRLAALVTAWWIATVSLAASAAEMKLYEIDKIAVVEMTGEIVEGDGDRFVKLVDSHDQLSVVLQSSGGLVSEALQIGAEIRLRNFTTMVITEAKCYSACALIWIAGAKRVMATNAEIGFHAAYREENGEYRESGVANAEIGSYLTHLGLNIEAIRFFTTAGPDQFLLLTPERAKALAIDVTEIPVGKTARAAPAEKNVDAEKVVLYSVLRARCMGLFVLDTTVIERAQADLIAAGQKAIGEEAWTKAWAPLLEVARDRIIAEGPLPVCLDAEAHLRGLGQPTGIDGPSFMCSNATTATEKTVCAEPDLWPRDRAMNAIYFYVVNYADAGVRKSLLDYQRNWLKQRNACAGDADCIRRVYDDQLDAVHDIDVDRDLEEGTSVEKR